jgi:sec-independent protein translocase protein TatB
VFNLDPAKLLVILVIALVVLGPERLPKAARQIGGVWHELTRLRDQVTEEVRGAMPDMSDLPKIPKIPYSKGSIASLLFDSSAPTASSTDEAGGVEGAADTAGANPFAPPRPAPEHGIAATPSPRIAPPLPDDPGMN